MEPRPSHSIQHVIAAAVVALLALTLVPASSAQSPADAFFAGDQLDDLWIHINSRDMQALRAHFDENTFYPCDVQWRTVRVYNAGCRSRGHGSRTPIKPGLDVHFDHYVSGQRFLGLSQLVLDNLYQDPSMLHERLTMWLFRRAGVPAPREAHVRLFVGGTREYAGVYAVVESIDTTFLASAFGDDGSGHLYEYRWVDVYHFEDLGRELEPYAARFMARTREFDSMAALYTPVRDLIETINDQPIERIRDALDLDAFVSQLAVENYAGDWDGLLGYAGLNNFYVYHRAGAPMRVIPWDKDVTFFEVTIPPWHNVEFNVLARKIWEDPVLMRRYLRLLLDAADAGAALADELERELAQIEAAALADPVKAEGTDGFVAGVERLRVFVRDRPAIVRAYVRQLAPDLVTGP